MYENTNQAAVLEIAKGSMKSHKLRNAMAILAILLTTLLITAVCTVGVSFYDTMQRGSDITPSPMSDGGIKADISKYEELKTMDDIVWAGYVRPCNIGSLHNKEMVGITSKLFAADDSYIKHNKITLKEGAFPSNSRELVISDTLEKRLGLKDSVGESIVLRPVILENGAQKEIEVPMTITGVYTSPMEPLHNIYEEMYTGEEFLTDTAPEMQSEEATLFVKLKNDKGTHYEELHAVKDNIGGSAVIYKTHTPMGLMEILLAAGFLILIMFCGYLIIYNIFYISVVNDIRFFGMMKTIGTTGKQIKKILSWQVLRLSAAGILLGVIAGYLVGIVASPLVMAKTNYADFYRLPTNPLGFAAAIVFAALTVAVSCRKSYRMAAKISPVEAARYSGGRNSKRKLWSVISFAISSLIFLIVYTGTIGFDVEKMVDRYHTADVRVSQDAMEHGSDEVYKPIDTSLVNELRALPFVKNVSEFYQARYDAEDQDGKTAEGKIPMRQEGKWQTEWKDYLSWQTKMLAQMGNPTTEEELRKVTEDQSGNMLAKIGAMPAEEIKREAKNVNIIDGTFDEEKFASGEYILYNQMGKQGKIPDDQHIKAGDKLPLTVYDTQDGTFKTVEKEVLAVYNDANGFSAGNITGFDIVLNDQTFMELFPEYQNFIVDLQLDGQQELTKTQYTEIKDLVQGTFNSQLTISSRYEERIQQTNTKNSMMLIGLFMAGIFGLIGITNVVNTLVTNVMTRKLEYAAMQSVGMTKRQMCYGLIADGMKIAGVSTAAAILAGITFGKSLLNGINMLTGFSGTEFTIAALILIAVLLIMTITVAAVLTNILNKKPVVERLREAE